MILLQKKAQRCRWAKNPLGGRGFFKQFKGQTPSPTINTSQLYTA
jgi:hypothetical protein